MVQRHSVESLLRGRCSGINRLTQRAFLSRGFLADNNNLRARAHGGWNTYMLLFFITIDSLHARMCQEALQKRVLILSGLVISIRIVWI